MLTAEEQRTLTEVGPGTPCGALLRRYWHPVAATCELPAGAVKPVRLLGEDLVLFRDGGGRPGLLPRRCPHRGASLAHGAVEADGIRCPYHGWKFAADGRCLETPAEPPGSPLAGQVTPSAARAAELGGLVFAYLGPEPAPLLPRFDLFVRAGVLRDVGQATLPCNWLQIMENSVDPHHVEWLHGARLAPSSPYRRRHERIGFDRFRYGIVKRRVLAGGSEQDDDWRVGHPLVFPTMLRVGAHRQHRFQIRVPIDDTHTWHLWYACYEPAEGAPPPRQDHIPLYDVPWRDADGGFRQDFIDGQDIMAWVSQGPIADRTRERLGDSDRGVVLLRRMLFEQIERVRDGLDPLGVVRDAGENEIIELPQEREKFGDGTAFLAESMEMGHARFSPIKDQVLALVRGRAGA